MRARVLAARIAAFGRLAGAVVEVSDVAAIEGIQIVLTRENVEVLSVRLKRELRSTGCTLNE